MSGGQSTADSARRTVSQTDPRGEARLLGPVAKGELRAFEELYRLYHPRLSRFLASVVRRPHLVEEALNDTMLAVWSQPDSYSGASKPSTWIFAIAYRKALKAMRTQDEPLEDKHAETRE